MQSLNDSLEGVGGDVSLWVMSSAVTGPVLSYPDVWSDLLCTVLYRVASSMRVYVWLRRCVHVVCTNTYLGHCVLRRSNVQWTVESQANRMWHKSIISLFGR
jgi:hypothetical protein